MPTFETASAPTSATTASFQTWVSCVHNLIISCGFTDISASGILDTSSTTPVVGGNKSGYRIYGFNDALQSTHPLFFRIDFGFFSGITQVSMWLSVGTSHVDGLISSHTFNTSTQSPLGNGGYNTGSSGQTWFTGSASYAIGGGGQAGLNEHQLAMNGVSAAPSSMSISGDGSYLAMALWWTGSSVALPGIVMTMERTHDINGNDDGRGCLLALGSDAGSTRRLHTLIFNSSSIGQYSGQEQGLPTIFRLAGSGSYSSSVGLGHQVAISSPQFTGPSGPEVSKNMIILQFGDTGSISIPQDIFVPIRGKFTAFRLYPPSVQSPASWIVGAPSNAQVRFGLRYER